MRVKREIATRPVVPSRNKPGVRLAALILAAAGCLSATTLQKLTLEQMAQQSTGVIRGRVSACASILRQQMVYTECRIAVRETWKGSVRPEQTVSIPGGVAGRVRQSFAGAPSLRPGDEYIFFLWTGRSGVTQVIGLSQGLLEIDLSTAGPPMAVRAPSRERMVDASGRAVRDDGVDIELGELRRLVEREAHR